MNILAVVSFFIFTLSVAIVSWYLTRKEDLSTTDGYFLGGRHLGWFVVGGSLFLSNLNAGSLVGNSEAVYLFNMSVIMWSVSAVFAMVLISEFILPIWLRFGVTTTPQFLGLRYGESIKIWVACILLASYALNVMPPVLYSGGVVFNGLFDISGVLGISDWQGLWVCVWAIGIVGAMYSVFGGLKAIATSDALNGIGLAIGGTAVPVFGLIYLGDGDFGLGLSKILTENREHLNSLGGPNDPVPWTTLFTGMLLVNLNYWGVEQYIIQRTLGSKNLTEGQKGITFGMFLKLISPIFIAVPGLIAVAIFSDITVSAEVYPRVVAEVVPSYMVGFIAAVIFGAALTTFNSGLNSAATIAMLDVYRPLKERKNKSIDDKQVIKVSKQMQLVLAVAAMSGAPFIAFASGGFYEYIQTIAGMFTIPVFTIVFVGFVSSKVPAIAAKVTIVFYIICYGYTQFVYDFGLHFLHIMAILFCCNCLIMFVIGYFKPQINQLEWPKEGVVDLTPWKHRYYFYTVAVVGVFLLIFWLSPFGIAI